MKKSVLGLAGIAALITSSAFAANLPVKAPPPPPPPVSNWTGCYVGATAGGNWGDSAFSWTNITEAPTAFAAGAATVLPAAADARLRSSNFTGGGEIGCNYQTGIFVVGVEGDIEYTGLSANRTAVSLGDTNGGPPTIVPGNIAESFSSNWLSTLRGRLGIANGAWLFYGTGGLAIADVSYSDQVCFPAAALPTCNTASSSGTRTGWAAGAGIEYKLTSNWSIKAEYLYADLGNTSYNSIATTATGATPNPGATITHNHTLEDNIARVGLNWHFGGGPIYTKD